MRDSVTRAAYRSDRLRHSYEEERGGCDDKRCGRIGRLYLFMFILFYALGMAPDRKSPGLTNGPDCSAVTCRYCL